MTPRMLHRMAENVQGGIEQLLLHASTLGYQMDKDALNGAVNELQNLKNKITQK